MYVKFLLKLWVKTLLIVNLRYFVFRFFFDYVWKLAAIPTKNRFQHNIYIIYVLLSHASRILRNLFYNSKENRNMIKYCHYFAHGRFQTNAISCISHLKRLDTDKQALGMKMLFCDVFGIYTVYYSCIFTVYLRKVYRKLIPHILEESNIEL